MNETGYTIPGSVNFKRLKHPELVSTTLDTKSNQLAGPGLLDHARRFRCIEGFLNHRLYEKFSSSQNYYFLRDVNAIVADERCKAVITFKDLLDFSSPKESCEKLYRRKEYRRLIAEKCEFYKFHKEIPRMFSKEIYDTFFDHHDKKRKVEYVIITRMLKEQAGEDLKEKLEEQLMKLRQVKFEPFLADLGPADRQAARPARVAPVRKTANDSVASLQCKLEEIFCARDASYSELLMQSFAEEQPQFKLFSAATPNPMSTVHMTPGPAHPPQRFMVSSLLTSALTSTSSSKNNLRLAGPSQARPSALGLDPAVVESLKRISFPDTRDPKKQAPGPKKPAPAPQKPQPRPAAPQQLGTGASSKQPPDRVFKKSLTREPSLSTVRNKSSHSIKRGLTLTKRMLEEEGTKSAKREFSDFRITKKQSLEADSGSPRKPEAQEKRTEPYLLKEDRLDAASTRGANAWLSSKRVPSAKRNTLIEAQKRSGDFEDRGPSHQSHADPGAHLKVDIERLLKASGLMDLRTTRASVARDAGTSLKQSSLAKHKYTKSGPESLAQLTVSTARPAQPTSSASFKHSQLHGPLRLASKEKDRIQPKEKPLVLGKKVSLADHKPLLAESSTFNQPAVKLIKKSSGSSHQKKASSRF